MRTRLSCQLLFVFAAAVSASACAAQQTTPAATTPALTTHDAAPAPTREPAGTYWTDKKFLESWNEGLLEKRRFHFDLALDAFRKADKLSGDGCLQCLMQMYAMQMELGKYKDAAATATRAEAVAVTPQMKSLAMADRGQALFKQGGKNPKPDQLEAAHTTFESALTEYPQNNTARWYDACVLTKMGKLDEASAAFASCAKQASPNDPMRVRAQHFAQEPKLSLEPMAPAFEVTTLDGSHFNLDNMTGHVVLIDFWATWCGPCNAELPHMQQIAKEFAGEPLVILSVSWDSDEAKWKDFIAKNKMTWQQYRDANHVLSQRFLVEAIPHYFTIDSDGVLTSEMMGSGSDVEGKLRKLLKRAKEAKPQPAVVAQGTN